MSTPESDHNNRAAAYYAFIKNPLDPEILSGIAGNAPDAVKQLPVKWLALYRQRGNSFAYPVAERLKVTEVSILTSPDDELKRESKVVCEIEVTEDMCTSSGRLHDGCIIFLIDEVSSINIIAFNAAEGRDLPSGVSNTINALFHAPAPVGTKLRVVSRTLAAGYQAGTARVEIFDTSTHQLVASGTQLMMPPSRLPKWKTGKL